MKTLTRHKPRIMIIGSTMKQAEDYIRYVLLKNVNVNRISYEQVETDDAIYYIKSLSCYNLRGYRGFKEIRLVNYEAICNCKDWSKVLSEQLYPIVWDDSRIKKVRY